MFCGQGFFQVLECAVDCADFTGDTSEHTLASVSIPAGLLKLGRELVIRAAFKPETEIIHTVKLASSTILSHSPYAHNVTGVEVHIWAVSGNAQRSSCVEFRHAVAPWAAEAVETSVDTDGSSQTVYIIGQLTNGANHMRISGLTAYVIGEA